MIPQQESPRGGGGLIGWFRRLSRSEQAAATIAGAVIAGVFSIVIALITSQGNASADAPGQGGEGGQGPGLYSTSPGGSPGAGASPAGTPVPPLAPASQGNSLAVPAGYLGLWQGTLDDNIGSEGPQTADLTINGGGTGTIVGNVTYPIVGCTYDFLMVSSQPSEVTVYEEARTGPCSSAYVVLIPVGRSLEENVYQGAPSQGEPAFTGQLSRVGSFG
jgi:hypothetical protein